MKCLSLWLISSLMFSSLSCISLRNLEHYPFHPFKISSSYVNTLSSLILHPLTWIKFLIFLSSLSYLIFCSKLAIQVVKHSYFCIFYYLITIFLSYLSNWCVIELLWLCIPQNTFLDDNYLRFNIPSPCFFTIISSFFHHL